MAEKGLRLQRYASTRANLMRWNSEAECREYELTLERLAGGSTVEQEADRLGVTHGSLNMFFNRDEELKGLYIDALEARSETIHDMQYAHARNMVLNAKTMERDEIHAIDKGLGHLEALKRSDGSRHRPNTKASLSITPDNLKDFLAGLDSAKKAKAIEDATIDAEYVDLTAQDGPE
jgi:hypothetical protein